MKEPIIDLLVANPVLLLFVVCALGYALGRVPFGKSRSTLGSTMVIFVGLALGAVDPRLRLPDIVNTFGLVLFMYVVGLNSANGFLRSWNLKGLRALFLGLFPLLFSAAGTIAVAPLLGLKGGAAAAVFAGSMSNASGLASVLDSVKSAGGTGTLLTLPVVTYSLTYPMSIVVPMILIPLFQRILSIDYSREAAAIPEYKQSMEPKIAKSILVSAEGAGQCTYDLSHADKSSMIVFGRIERAGTLLVPDDSTALEEGDKVIVFGNASDVDQLIERVGYQIADSDNALDQFVLERVIVSNVQAVGKTLKDLDLVHSLGIKLTSIHRNSHRILPDGNSKLQFGDSINVMAQKDNLTDVKRFFGDDFNVFGRLDFLALSLGITLGLLLGLVPIPLPGGLHFKLGFAGGPLIAAIVLGNVGRTGRIVWRLPYSLSSILNQLGLILFAAGIGTQAGYDFFHVIREGTGVPILLAGAGLCALVFVVTLVIGYLLMKVPFTRLLGIYAGGQTQPIVLDFINGQTKNDIASGMYAAVFPLAIVTKIVLGQVLYLLLK